VKAAKIMGRKLVFAPEGGYNSMVSVTSLKRGGMYHVILERFAFGVVHAVPQLYVRSRF
jgi:hypothetical protein